MTEAYEVIIAQDGAETTEEQAVSNAVETLEQITTESGIEIDVFNTTPYGGDENRDYGIGINFAILSDLRDEELNRFFEELNAHDLVETYESVHYEPVE